MLGYDYNEIYTLFINIYYPLWLYNTRVIPVVYPVFYVHNPLTIFYCVL